MPKRLRGIVAALPLLGASIALVLAIAEVCLRLIPQLMPEEFQLRLHWRDITKPVTQGDSYLGYVFPSNYQSRIEGHNGSFAFNFSTDDHGFRNSSPWPQRAHIVVLGDSMAFSYGVEDNEAWPAVLAEQLPGSRIINLGLMGAAPQQYFRIYETFGQSLEPDLVLFCLFPGNDVKDAGLFARWERAGSKGDYYVQRFLNDDANPEVGIRGLLRQSYFVILLRYAWRNTGSQLRGRTIDFPDGGQMQLAPSFRLDLEHQDRANFRLAMDAVHQTRELAERNGSEFLVVLVPTKEAVYLPLLGEEPPAVISQFVEELKAAGIPYLDLTPGFQARARQQERLFFKVDGHPNAAGYRLVADLILDHLRSDPDRYQFADLQ
jgi:lysophospholipase L1-like esterase